MKIERVDLGHLSVPLRKPFKTALRTVESVEDVLVRVVADTGDVGYGEAAPTPAITGDTRGAIRGAIEDCIRKAVLGRDVLDLEGCTRAVERSCVGNTSAKAALDIALHDLWARAHKAPLWRLLGGHRPELETDLTISVNEPDEMARDAVEAVGRGFRTLKIKVGKDGAKDMDRLRAVREAVGPGVGLRVDANQGWSAREAVRTIRAMEAAGLGVELVEQPVAAGDLEGLKYVTDHVDLPVMADESLHSPEDALAILRTRAADLLNIKLMKAGGLRPALRICALAEAHGVECMVGCMLESSPSVAAAAALAAARACVTRCDLDAPLLCREDPAEGGTSFEGPRIRLNETPGLGVTNIRGARWDV